MRNLYRCCSLSKSMSRFGICPWRFRIRFALTRTAIHGAYDPQYANAFWRILVTVDAIFKEFRGRFLGKVSPVHFFWGSFDLAVTRFSGRRAPERPARTEYPGSILARGEQRGLLAGRRRYQGSGVLFLCGAAASGFRQRAVRPAAASYDKQLGEFLLLYDDVRAAASPRDALLDFCQSTYEAAADLGNWDRAALEKRRQSRGTACRAPTLECRHDVPTFTFPARNPTALHVNLTR